MNLVSAMVGLSIVGIAAPTVLEMSVSPIIAQKRAGNFSKAESSAVVYAAANEGKTELTDAPGNCSLSNNTNHPAYEITCEHGNNKLRQTVSRSFKLNTGGSNSGGYKAAPFQYPYPTFGFTSTECHGYENWGIDTGAYDNEKGIWLKKSCMPSKIRSESNYKNSEVSKWQYNINNYNGYGDRSDEIKVLIDERQANGVFEL